MRNIHGAGRIEPFKNNKGKTTGYRFRFNLGKNPITGKYEHSPWRSVYGSKAKALKAMAQYRIEIEQGLSIDDAEITFGAFADRFVSHRAALGSYSPATIRHDKQQIAKLNRFFENVKLKDITVSAIQSFMAALGKEGATPNTTARALAVLKKILKEATNQDILMRNPADKIKPLKVEKREMKFLNCEELARMVAALDEYATGIERPNKKEQQRLTEQRKRKHAKKGIMGERVSGMFAADLMQMQRTSRTEAIRLILATGIRRGECLGLTWGRFDAKGACINIQKQFTIDGFASPKTEHSKRKIVIDRATVEHLEKWKVKQAAYLLKLGIKQNSDTPMFANELGGFVDPNHFARWWRSFCEHCGFKNLRIHDLRHTAATLLVSEGVDIVTTSNRLGHANPSITLNIYSHALPSKDYEAAELMGRLMSKKPPKMGEVVSL